MKNKILSLVAVIMTAIFLLSSLPVMAAPSREKVNKDYREMDLKSINGATVKKPVAQFLANRVVDGEVCDFVASYTDYDCNEEFPTLVCYVGDTLTFTDLSRDTNGGKIAEWDWQHYGALGDHNNIYKRNILNETSISLTEPGETIFYLCVKSDVKVKNGSCDPWSENGNHQIVGKNKWFPKGLYWYFTAIRVDVKPVREAAVNVRYWDSQNNSILFEERLIPGLIYKDTEAIDTQVHINDLEGYSFDKWNVRLSDGTVQYSGTDKEVGIILSGWIPEKYLDVEFYPYQSTEVEIRYWDKSEGNLISKEKIPGKTVLNDQETNVTVALKTPDGYRIDGWNVQLPDGTVQYEGADNPTDIILSGYIPKKILNVKCYPLSDKKVTVNYIDSETKQIISSKVIRTDEQEEHVTVPVGFESIPGYVVENWTLKLPDDTVENEGTDEPVNVILTSQQPHKILDIICLSLDNEYILPMPTPTIVVKPSGICNGIITWTETDSHRVFTGYSKSNKKQYRTCSHTFTYQTVLSANAVISPSTLKSGYGFELDVNCFLNTKMTSNKGNCSSWGNNRTYTARIMDPTTVTVYLPWNMINRLGTQEKSISMVSNGKLKFRLPINPVSEAGARRIYTPVELAGTKESPQTHSFEIFIGGGGVNNVEFCKKIDGTITINGDMYEDDFSGAD